MTPVRLRELCDEWKHRLGLGGWTIEAEFTNRSRDVDDGCAMTEYSTSTRDASIKVLRHKYRSKKQLLLKKDYEVDLVHELMHLWLGRFETVQPGSERWMKLEQFVEAQARALVGLKRERDHARRELAKAHEQAQDHAG